MTDTEMLLDAIKGYQHGRIGMSRDVREAFTALLRRDWSVRVLDAWQKAHVMHAEPFRCYAPFDLETDAPLNWLCTANADDGESRRFLAATPDAARHAAALAVYPTLPADVRAKLGECP
jgi:hypothetical protein